MFHDHHGWYTAAHVSSCFLHNPASCFCITERDKNSDRMERDALSEQKQQRRRSRSHDAKKSQRDRRCLRWRRTERQKEEDALIIPPRIHEEAHEDRQVQPYVWYAITIDRDGPRRFFPSRVPRHLVRPESSVFSNERYRISCVYLGMRPDRACNSIRQSRTEDSRATRIGSGRASYAYYACVYTARMIEDGFTYKSRQIFPRYRERASYPLYASELLDLRRESEEKNRN